MVQIIQICKRLFFLLIALSFTNVFVIPKNLFANDYGSYLAWSYARKVTDFNNLKFLFSTIDVSSIDDGMMEEALFQSVIFENWEKANEVSKKILRKNENNVSATFYFFVDSFLKKTTTTYNLKKSHFSFLDKNFQKAISLWTTKKTLSESQDFENCIPLICLHIGAKLLTQGKKNKAEKFFLKVEEQKFSSLRIRELLFLSFLELNRNQNAKKIHKDLSLKDMNLKKISLNYFENNKYLLNPIKTNMDGLAEVLYNISSWYYQKDLYKYAIFFGKLSLKIRPNFNAMKLLVVNAFEEIGFGEMASDTITKINERNPYYMRFLKIRSSLNKEDKKKLVIELEKLSKSYPDNWEVTILLADKYRGLEKYDESINLYTRVIEKNNIENKLPILYSRGIAYERLNKWNKAEKDFKEALLINPDDPYILNYLGYSWLDRKLNLDEALELLKKAAELQPNDGYIIDSLGWAFYLTGNFEKSIYYLEKALSIMPNDATLNDHLGDAYWKSGRKKEAISQWQRVLIIKPEYKHSEIVKKKIEGGIK